MYYSTYLKDSTYLTKINSALAEQRPVGKIEDYEPMKNGSQPQKDVQQVQKASAPGSKAQTQTPSTGKQNATGRRYWTFLTKINKRFRLCREGTLRLCSSR